MILWWNINRTFSWWGSSIELFLVKHVKHLEPNIKISSVPLTLQHLCVSYFHVWMNLTKAISLLNQNNEIDFSEWNIGFFIVKHDHSLPLYVRFAEDVWYSCWSSAHCDRGEWNVASCNWWVCTCASFSRNQCFPPATQTQGSHASYWDQLLPSHHALHAILDSQHLPAWLKQFVLIVTFVFLSFLWLESLSSSSADLLSQKIWMV